MIRLCFLVLALCLGSSVLWAQEAENRLLQVSLGVGEDYTRLVFNFEQPVNDYVLRRVDVNRLVIDFGRMPLPNLPLPAQDAVIDRVSLLNEGGRLTAQVDLGPMRYELRHFASLDGYSLIVDVKNLEQPGSGAELTPVEPGLSPELARLPELSRQLSLPHDSSPEEEPADRLYRQILLDLAAERYDDALGKITSFISNYPQHPLNDPVRFLLGETVYAQGALEENYAQVTEAFNDALNLYPDSPLAPRASFQLGRAAQEMGNINEAEARYKLTAAEYPDDPLAGLSTLYAVDLSYSMGLIDEGRALLEPLLAQGLSVHLGLLAYARLGMGDFLEGLYSQANENFREVLRQYPQVYLEYPEILYAIGEGYHYLRRPDLARIFLSHALNLMPESPMADVMLARIGDAYRAEGKDREAMAVYGVARQRFPDRDGGMVSQVRLADMGALHSFFRDDRVFDVLERGTRQATVEMYKEIVATDSDSPLMQLAYLKIGQTLAEDGDNTEAIQWLRDLILNYPRSSLLPEASPTLSRALVNEAELRSNLEDWPAVTALYQENSAYLQDADIPAMQRLAAEAYEQQGLFDEAREVWKAIEDESPEGRLARAQALVTNSLLLGRPLEAFDYWLEMAEAFPENHDWLQLQLSQIGRDLALSRSSQATDDLLRFRSMISDESIRRQALADAVAIELDGGRDDRALTLMDAYAQEYPEDELTPEYALTQAEIEKRQERYDDYWARLSLFRTLYPEDSRGPKTLLDQISLADELGQFDDAFRFMELYRQRYPDDPEGRALLLQRLRQEWDMGRLDDSDSSLDIFLQGYPGDPRIPDLILTRIDQSWAADRLERADQLTELFRRLYPDDPRTPGTWLDQYKRYVAAGQLDRAFQIAQDFRRDNPDAPLAADLMLEEAKDKFASGLFNEGLALWDGFRQSYPEDPRTPELLLIQARQELKEGYNSQALGHFREFIDTYPEDAGTPGVYLELAVAEMNLGRDQEAYDDLGRYRSLYPDHPSRPQSTLDQIALASSLGLVNEAAALYREFRQDYPDHPAVPQTYVDQARLELAARRIPQAVATMEEGFRSSPMALEADPQAGALLADLYLEDGRVEDWSAMVERNLDRDPLPQADLPGRFFKYNQLGQVNEQLGRVSDAERNFDAALANRPPDVSPESVYGIASAYKKMGLINKYRETLEIVRNLGDPFWQQMAENELAGL